MTRQALIILLMTALAYCQVTTAQTRRQIKEHYRSPQNYEAQIVGVGVEGTKVVKVWAFGKNVEEAIVKAKQLAVDACLFRGIAGKANVEAVPAICQSFPTALSDNQEFFNTFFAPDGDYLQFIALTTDGIPAGQDRLKMKTGYQVGLVVQVFYTRLQNEMINLGIIQNATQGDQLKPVLMILPSDRFCYTNKFYSQYNDASGTTKTVSDYSAAMLRSEELRMVISKLSQMMVSRGYVVKDLEQSLKHLSQTDLEKSVIAGKNTMSSIAESPYEKITRGAKPDIVLDLDFSIKSDGPRKYISFNLKAVDAYTQAPISTTAGDGKPSSSVSPGTLLEEALINRIDPFNQEFQKYFLDMLDRGRLVTASIMVFDAAKDDIDLENEYDWNGNQAMLYEHIQRWFKKNCTNKDIDFNISETQMTVNNMRIPLFQRDSDGENESIDTRMFMSRLRRELSKAPFNIESKIVQRGLGEVWLILGDK